MLKNLFRQKPSKNIRKFYKPNFKLHNTNIQKNKRNYLYENELYEDLIAYQQKNKFFKQNLSDMEKTIKKRTRNKLKIQKKKPFDFNDIKKFAENLKFDKETKIILDIGFEDDIQRIKNAKNNTDKDLLKFEKNFTELVEKLGNISDNELIQFLRHSVALKASPSYEHQAKGILLKQSIKEEIDKRFENEVQRTETLNKLVKKLAMKIIYGKIDQIIKQKNQGTSYEHNDVIQMVLEDPCINPNSFFAQELLSNIYKNGEGYIKMFVKEDSLSSKNLYEQHFQQQYFKARAEILCTLGQVDLNMEILIPQEEAKELLSRNQMEQNQQQEFKELTLHLHNILADFTIHNNLNNSIKNLERQLNIYKKNLPSLEQIAVNLDALLQNLPKKLKQKYFDKNQNAEDKSKYINESYNQEELQWNTVNQEIPCEVMRIDEQQDEKFRQDKMGKIENIQRSYHFYHCQNPTLFHLDAEEEYYQDSDQELDEHSTNAWHQAEENFDKIEFDNYQARVLHQMNINYLNLIEKQLYLTRNPQSQKKETTGLVSLYDVPGEVIADEYFQLQDNEFKKTLKHNYLKGDKNLQKKDNDDQLVMKTSNFNFITKKNYDKLWNSRNLQAVRSVLGRDIHGSKLHRYLFHNGQWYIGKKIPFRNNNYKCFDQDEINENDDTSEFIDGDLFDAPSAEQYNDYLVQKYEKYKSPSVQNFSYRTKGVFDQFVVKTQHKTLDDMPFYNEVTEYYKETNNSYFFNHYIQNAVKEFQLFSQEQKIDFLDQEIDPNFGFYNIKDGMSQYSKEYLNQKTNNNTMISKLNQKLTYKEDQLEELRKIYPDLFQSKKPTTKQDLETAQIFSSTGSRKKARATAVLKIPGTGKVKVNNREFTEYFFLGDDRYHILKPIILIDKQMEVDLEFFVYGGNTSTQSEAGKLALSRAICKAYPEQTTRFRKLHFLYRDPRTKESKKISSYGARKSYTYVRR